VAHPVRVYEAILIIWLLRIWAGLLGLPRRRGRSVRLPRRGRLLFLVLLLVLMLLTPPTAAALRISAGRLRLGLGAAHREVEPRVATACSRHAQDAGVLCSSDPALLTCMPRCQVFLVRRARPCADLLSKQPSAA